ncbi:Alpha/Beta hydrolase protein [Entophlyctis helioformis]|nr:Alpha/Beta hydrolase protein [Entophlyctis helioformis]
MAMHNEPLLGDPAPASVTAAAATVVQVPASVSLHADAHAHAHADAGHNPDTAKTQLERLASLGHFAGFVLQFLPTLVHSTAHYFLRGPAVSHWPLNFHVVWSVVRSLMHSANKKGDIEEAQRFTMRPGALPKTGRMRSTELPRSRAAIEFMRASMTATPFPPEAEQDGSIYAEWVWHEAVPDSGHVVYMLHGGGYSLGSAQMIRPLSYRIAKMGKAKAFAINYRLAPPNPFPCAVIDAISGYEFLLSQGIPPSKIVFDGESAGGGLILATLLALRDMGLPLPAGGVLMSPWVDLTHSFPSFLLNETTDYLPARAEHPALGDRLHFYAPNEELRNQFVSPVWAKSLAGLPPLLIQVGSAERLFDEDVHLAERITAEIEEARNKSAAAIATADTDATQPLQQRPPNSFVRLEIYTDQVHVFQMFSFLAASRAAFNRVAAFILDVTGRSEIAPLTDADGHYKSTRSVIDHKGNVVDNDDIKAKL